MRQGKSGVVKAKWMSVTAQVLTMSDRIIPRSPIAQKKGAVRQRVETALMAETSATRLRWRRPLRMEISPAVMVSANTMGDNSAMSHARLGSSSKNNIDNNGAVANVSRTAKMVTVIDGLGEKLKRKVSEWQYGSQEAEELIHPYGHYSMAPCVGATDDYIKG